MNFAGIEEDLHDAVRRGVFPGAVLLVRDRDRTPYLRAFGRRGDAEEFGAMTRDTVFDVSSLTKAFATSVALMQLVAAGKLALDDAAAKYFPAFIGAGRETVTVRQLASHASGLPAWRAFFEEIRAADRPDFLCRPTAKAYVYDEIARQELQSPPGSAAAYSDLGFILLGAIIEATTGIALDEYCDAHIFAPLGLQNTHFVDLAKPGVRREFAAPVAPTERCAWRGTVVRGVVHDDNAYAMGGVAGHAGLFSTAADLDSLLCHLRDAYCGRSLHPLVPSEIVAQFWRRAETAPESTWCLGWDTPSAVASSSGTSFSPHSVGHLGFTGVSAWLDLEAEHHVILLSNRVHPTRRNEAIREFRPYIHDRIAAAFGWTKR